MDNTLFFNALPRPTFRWLKVNYTEGTIWNGKNRAHVSVDAHDGVVTPLTNTALLNEAYEGVDKTTLQDVAEHFTTGLSIHVPAGQYERVKIAVQATGDVEEKLRLKLVLEEGAKLDFTLLVTGEATGGHIATFTEIDSKPNSYLKFGKVQLLEGHVQQFEHRYAEVHDEAHVDFVNIELGATENFLNYREELIGEKSEVTHDLGYCGNDKQKFDINMLMSHIGKKTISNINNVGALDGEAKKSFRGTLDFIRGSIGSEGAEEDMCLLLNEKVKSISLPLLLCKEDNVSGNHAASAGQLDKDKLFYLMSRGFNETEAKHIIVESMLRPLIDRIGHEEIEEVALEVLRRKI